MGFRIPVEDDQIRAVTDLLTSNPQGLGNPSAAAVSDTAVTIEPSSLPSRFPTYPWDNGQCLCADEEELTIQYEVADNPKTFGTVIYTTIVNDHGKLQRATRRVPAEIWQPLSDWLHSLRWTMMQPTEGAKCKDHGGNVTWAELAVEFQRSTGFDIISKHTFLDAQIDCFAAACATVMSKAQFATGGNMCTFRTAMRPRGTILTTATFTGAPAPGLQRRPVWNRSTTSFVAKVLYDHHCRACELAAEANGTWRNDYSIKFDANRPRWVPSVLADANCKMLQMAVKRKAEHHTPNVDIEPQQQVQRAGPCHFGHNFTTAAHKGQPYCTETPLPSFW